MERAKVIQLIKEEKRFPDFVIEGAITYKIDQSGKVKTIAGNGTIGDIDGKGEEALFNEPRGIAIDNSDIV